MSLCNNYNYGKSNIYFNGEKFAYNVLDDAVVILEVEKQNIIVLNSTAKFIFEKLLEQKIIDEIVKEFFQTFEDNELLDSNMIYNDFAEIINKLIKKGIFYEC